VTSRSRSSRVVEEPDGLDRWPPAEQGRAHDSQWTEAVGGVIILKRGLLEIKKVLEQGPNAKLAVKTPHVPRPGRLAIAVKLIDAQFPPYDQVIPREHKKIITVGSASCS
jgi:DNA polymerase III sliding clamp (beta) subunit (PCNA family)